MPSTFFGLNIASSAVNAFQAAINTTGNNISNVQTKGYSKQVANRQAAEGLRVYQKYGTTGAGVTTTSITSLRSSYYDTKYWENQSAVGLYSTKLNYLKQIEDYFTDEGTANPGFSTCFSNMFNEMNGLIGDAGDENKRKSFISQAKIFTTYFNNVANGLSRLQKDTNDQIKTLVETINADAEKIASLTKQINSIELQGGMANELRDQRALIIDELSEIVPITVEESPVTNSNYPDMYVGGTNYIVKLDGQTIVDTFEYRTLTCVPREHKVNQTDVEGLYNVVWSDTGMKFNMNAKSMDGSLKALLEIRDGNNAENFQGQVLSAGVSSVTIKPSTMTTVESMTMAEEGIITIKNKEYHYSGFSVKLDADGNVESYTFQFDDRLDAATISDLPGKQAKIGETVDAMGIPYFMGQMSEFIRAFSSRFNAYQQEGVDLNNNPMGSFFVGNKYDGSEYDFSDQKVGKDGVTDPASVVTSTSNSYYQLNALNFTVADASLRNSAIFSTTVKPMIEGDKESASDIITAMQVLQNDEKIFRGGSASGFLECIYSDIVIDAGESEIFLENFSDISSAITNQRLSISGVDEDEEALDLVKFQNAYNLAARMVQCMAEMYDRLITQTGV